MGADHSQGPTSNHCKLLLLRAMVVSIAETLGRDTTWLQIGFVARQAGRSGQAIVRLRAVVAVCCHAPNPAKDFGRIVE